MPNITKYRPIAPNSAKYRRCGTNSDNPPDSLGQFEYHQNQNRPLKINEVHFLIRQKKDVAAKKLAEYLEF